jgi:hypothetical protein
MTTSEITDEALMDAIVELTSCPLDPQTRAHIQRIERTGLRVTIYAVRETGAVLMIAHSGARPTLSAIRQAYRTQLESSGALT